MTVSPNTDVVRRFYAEAINDRDLAAVDRLLTKDFVHNGEARGRSGQRLAVQAFLEAFSDLNNEIEFTVEQGDLVTAHQTWTGTHDGEFLGVEPTGRRIAFTSTAVLRISDGMISRAWDEADLFGLMQQIQAVPAAPAE